MKPLLLAHGDTRKPPAAEAALQQRLRHGIPASLHLLLSKPCCLCCRQGCGYDMGSGMSDHDGDYSGSEAMEKRVRGEKEKRVREAKGKRVREAKEKRVRGAGEGSG